MGLALDSDVLGQIFWTWTGDSYRKISGSTPIRERFESSLDSVYLRFFFFSDTYLSLKFRGSFLQVTETGASGRHGVPAPNHVGSV